MFCYTVTRRSYEWILLWRFQTHSRPAYAAMLCFYFPTNADTVSQPLNAWENDNAFDPGPNDVTISWIGIHRKSSPFPNVVNNLSIFKWSSKTTTLIKTSPNSLCCLIFLVLFRHWPAGLVFFYFVYLYFIQGIAFGDLLLFLFLLTLHNSMVNEPSCSLCIMKCILYYVRFGPVQKL